MQWKVPVRIWFGCCLWVGLQNSQRYVYRRAARQRDLGVASHSAALWSRLELWLGLGLGRDRRLTFWNRAPCSSTAIPTARRGHRSATSLDATCSAIQSRMRVAAASILDGSVVVRARGGRLSRSARGVWPAASDRDSQAVAWTRPVRIAEGGCLGEVGEAPFRLYMFSKKNVKFGI